MDGEIIIGVDEAGRGCLAGSVYAGAVILAADSTRKDLSIIQDSKKMSEERREEVFEKLILRHKHGIGFATVQEITEINILNAAFLAMRRALEALQLSKEEWKRAHILVDGDMKIREWTKCKQTPIIKGDSKEKCIGAASILAKVSRDRDIRNWGQELPHYGFSEHKGYATEAHRQAIRQYGPSQIHRPTFAGVKEYLNTPNIARDLI